MIYDHATIYNPWCLKIGPAVDASIFGPTCDGFDRITDCCGSLPEVGDFIMWDKMGAYTTAAATNFNGFATPLLLQSYVDPSQ